MSGRVLGYHTRTGPWALCPALKKKFQDQSKYS